MHEEKEVKFLDIDATAIENTLLSIGAIKVGEFAYRRRVFDYPDWRLDKDHSWLRLRDEGEKIILAFKHRLGVAASDGSTIDTGMEEIEVVVDDFDTTTLLLTRIGFIEKHYAENRRVRWVKDGVEFDLDSWPQIPTYLEIEAPTWEQIDEAITWLGLNPADKKIFSTNQVYALYGIDVTEHARLTFDGLVKR